MAKDAKSNQDIRAEQKQKKQERKYAQQQAEKKKARQHTLIFAGILVVLALFAALLIFNKCSTSGSSERNTVVASTENFEVNQAMMTYFFNSSYNTYANYYNSYSSSDSTQFNDFVNSVNSRGTEYNSLMSITKQQVEQILTYAEMAKAEGYKLEDSDYDEIDSAVESYKDQQKSYGESNNAYAIMTFDKFLSTIFGDSVNEDVLRDCLELTHLASKYQEETVEAYEYTDEQYEEYFGEHSENYLYVDYLTYTFEDPEDNTADAETAEDAAAADAETAEDTAEDAEAADDSETDDNSDEAKAVELAEALALTTTPEEFTNYMTDYFTAEQEKNTAEGDEVDMDAVQTKVDALAKTKQLKSSISDEEAKEWAFADDTAVGATKLVTDEEAGKFTVYMITATSYRDEEITKNAAVLYLTDDKNDGNSQAKAEEIKAEWDKGEKTEEAFLALSEKYSESSHNHVEEGYTKNTADIGEWLYEEGRAEGDVGIVYSETNKCTYIVYFAGDGDEAWKTSVRSAISSEDFEAAVKEFTTAHKVNDDEENPSIVTYDEAALKKVKPISISTK